MGVARGLCNCFHIEEGRSMEHGTFAVACITDYAYSGV